MFVENLARVCWRVDRPATHLVTPMPPPTLTEPASVCGAQYLATGCGIRVPASAGRSETTSPVPRKVSSRPRVWKDHPVVGFMRRARLAVFISTPEQGRISRPALREAAAQMLGVSTNRKAVRSLLNKAIYAEVQDKRLVTDWVEVWRKDGDSDDQ